MGLEAIYQKPNTSRSHAGHKPYLLHSLVFDRPNQSLPPRRRGCGARTSPPDQVRRHAYIPMAKGLVYLVAVMDWFSRRVLTWRVSITMDTAFCVEALQEAMDRHGQLEIFNTDQRVQFTSADFLGELETRGVRITMDGKGRYLDNIFIERLWRSLKYQEVYIRAYGSVSIGIQN